MAKNPHLFVVILAGGGGTRLWPKSREKTPKQFLKLYTKNTLMQDAYTRISPLVEPDHVIVVSNKNYVEEVRRQLPDVPKENIIGEPAKKETAAAMLLGGLVAKHIDPEAVIINQASDQILVDHKEFLHVVSTASDVATTGESIVTVGISPTFPHTGFGYIKIHDQVAQIGRLPVFKVQNFTEKPNYATAKAFIATGKYFWNANMYVWKASALIEAFKRYCPSTLSSMQPIEQSFGTPAFQETLEKAYSEVDKISIDYAISEKADNLVLIPGDFGWNDIGDWKVVYDLHEKTDAGNVIMCEDDKGQVVCHDSKNNLIHTHDRLIALVGMEDTVVVDTGEILLVMPRDKSQDVKKIVEKLKAENPNFL